VLEPMREGWPNVPKKWGRRKEKGEAGVKKRDPQRRDQRPLVWLPIVDKLPVANHWLPESGWLAVAHQLAGRRSTSSRKGKKIMFHLEPTVAFWIHSKYANFSFLLCKCCRFSIRKWEEVEDCCRPLLADFQLHLQTKAPPASTVRFPSPLPTVLVDPSNEGFDIAFKRWREEIGQYKEEYIDGQKKDLCATHSSCEELDEEDF
jgi:hypothetical protein